MNEFKPFIKTLVKYYYKELGNGSGGFLHIVLDDGNIEHEFIRQCRNDCEKHNDTFGMFLSDCLLACSEEELETLYETDWWGMDKDKSDFLIAEHLDAYRNYFENPQQNFFRDSLTSYLANQRIKQREQQIIDKLQQSGFSISEIGNLEEFLKTRCHIVKSETDKRYSLFADNKLVDTWYDTIEIQTTTNDKGEITVTAIMGNPLK